MSNPFGFYTIERLAERLRQRIQNGDFTAVVGFCEYGYCVFRPVRPDGKGNIRVRLECTPQLPGRGPTRTPFPQRALHSVLRVLGCYHPEITSHPEDEAILCVQWTPPQQPRLL